MNRTLVSLAALVMTVMLWQPGLHAQTPAPTTKSPQASATVVNINTATVEQLENLPGVGAKMAARIVDYRQKNGGFKKIEDLMNIQGIGEKNFLKLKPLVSVGPAKAAAGAAQESPR